MTLIISHALPQTTVAPALVEPFARQYKELAHLFNAKQAKSQAWHASEHGCTPTEGLKLLQSGYQAAHGLAIGSGLGPLHSNVTQSDQTAWVAQMCATVISQERATVVPLSLIEASATDIAGLQEAASPLFGDDGDGIQIEPLADGLWRVHADFEVTSQLISPLALMGQDLGDWWPTAPAWRHWRKRVNEIQMAWHDHPINQMREQKGLPAINSVWLYGGGKGFTPAANPATDWVDTLSLASSRGDWQSWLDNWAEIAPLVLAAEPGREIVLTGDDRIVRLTNAPKRWWQNLFAKQQQDSWRKWWLNQN